MSLLRSCLQKSTELILSHQSPEGYWWYTLEANESIGAGYIQLMHFLDDVDPQTQSGLVQRMLSQQQPDGSWTLFFDGPGDISVTVECYVALRLAGHPEDAEPLARARRFILSQGGVGKARVFTRIHLALLGLAPWSSCPSMPIWFGSLPPWLGVSVYEFSSWARACILPLLIVGDIKPVRKVGFDIRELHIHPNLPPSKLWGLPSAPRFLSWRNFFLRLDFLLKWLEKIPAGFHLGKKRALRQAEEWIRSHIARTEDIYPAMAYAAMAISALGYPNSDATIQKALKGLKRFQQSSSLTPQDSHKISPGYLHQQCCISPNWDTPWAAVALLESGVSPQDPRLLQAARYMVRMEVKDFRGDWSKKNPQGPVGGWSFEFQNDYFPDVDDTIEALFFLKNSGIPDEEKKGPIQRGMDWLLSMQSDNGGWAAFDKNNLASWVNEIPFSDHGACLDPPTPDITGRMLELLALMPYPRNHPIVTRALDFIWRTQEGQGQYMYWRGRWGVNFLYGTWCVLQGLSAIGWDRQDSRIQKTADWICHIQNPDGGWGESCLSDRQNAYVPLGVSTASQTAWAVMALLSVSHEGDWEKSSSDNPRSLSLQKGITWLIEHQLEDGSWEESHYTGTGFPGHFYLRYHGYRHYFPLLALAKAQKNG